MIFHVITIFPEMYKLPIYFGVLHRGMEKGVIEVRAYNLRDYTQDRHRSVDDRPYGGGAGMVMMVEPVVRAIEDIKLRNPIDRTILLSASGNLLRHQKVNELATLESLLLICGRYEGIDERILEFVDEEISIGEYVLTGGEFPALVLIDAVSRLVEGVVGNLDSLKEESFSEGLLEYPQYTRPQNFRGLTVPDVLLSGDHKKIREWRREKSLEKTRKNR